MWTDEGRATEGIGAALTLLLAVACGVAVANLYYAQPLLSTIAAALHTGSGTAGLLVTFAQIGYAAGLAFVVPVGDLVPRRRLVPVVLTLTAAALAASAAAPGIAALVALAALVGLGSVAAQILVPLAASLAGEAERGRVVGTVMSGLLLGILLARTVSGLVAGASSWRVVYVAAAVLCLALAVVLARALPADPPRPRLSYGGLLHSTLSIFVSEPLLRRRALLGALGFAAFSIFWTTAAFLLAGAPYHYSDTVIGLFGLVGAAGALCATVAGRFVDRGWSRATTLVFSGAVAVSFLPIFLGHRSLVALIAGIVVLDIGVQGLQVTNQGLVYRLAPAARSRVNASYMVCYFAGGAVGSAAAGAVYQSAGWLGVCVAGGAVGVAATGAAALEAIRPVGRD
ncbi:MAG TPA: MFS transporter [Acidimicrobiales bacterium]|nr:MFS transporter [Acidimicrobiales bacterium]